MSCELCFQPFNLTTRQPLQLPCCNETNCKECKLQITSAPQQDTFQCPIKDCGEQNSCQANFKINKFAEKLLRESLSILCDKHPNDLAEFFCKEHELLVCTECALKEHKSHDTFKINKKMLFDYHKIILEKLTIQYRRIAKLMEIIEAYQKNQMVFTASKYIKTVKKAINILSPQMETQEEKEIIKFINQEPKPIQQNQFVQIQQEVHPIIQSIDSLIITNEDHSFIKECFGQANIRLELLYRGSRDTFVASAFHAKCDNQGPTLSIIKSQHNRVFGGYASVSWKSESFGVYVEDANAFILSISNKTKHTQYKNYKNALLHNTNRGPIFGQGHDIRIYNNCNCGDENFCNLGGTYSLPNGVQINTNESKSYLAGSYTFTVTEIEVFKVIIY